MAKFDPNSPLAISGGELHVEDGLEVANESNPSHWHKWRYVLSSENEATFKKEYMIPKSMALRFSGFNKGAEPDDKTREVCVYELMFKAGLRLPAK